MTRGGKGFLKGEKKIRCAQRVSSSDERSNIGQVAVAYLKSRDAIVFSAKFGYFEMQNIVENFVLLVPLYEPKMEFRCQMHIIVTSI